MPNTFGHFGIQGAATRLGFRDVDVRWILLGCVLPDVPWILRRIVGGVAPFESMLYFTAQSALAVSLLLCAAVALLTPRPRVLFALFGVNAVLHLLLDACQTKWGNGVALFAPLSWPLFGFDLFWPEDWPSHVLTALGVVFVLAYWRRGLWAPLRVDFRRWRPAVALLLLYFLVPFAMVGPTYRADVRYARTLREERLHQPVAFDRASYDGRLRAWDGRDYELHAEQPPDPGVISVRGTLRASRSVEADAVHVHAGHHRDLASLAALVLLAAALSVGTVRSLRQLPEC